MRKKEEKKTNLTLLFTNDGCQQSSPTPQKHGNATAHSLPQLQSPKLPAFLLTTHLLPIHLRLNNMADCVTIFFFFLKMKFCLKQSDSTAPAS